MKTTATIIILLITHTGDVLGQTTSSTGRTDAFGRTLTHFWGKGGQRVGKAYTSKPDAFGRQKTIYYDKHGKQVGKSYTRKPDAFGRKITTFFRKGKRK